MVRVVGGQSSGTRILLSIRKVKVYKMFPVKRRVDFLPEIRPSLQSALHF